MRALLFIVICFNYYPAFGLTFSVKLCANDAECRELSYIEADHTKETPISVCGKKCIISPFDKEKRSRSITCSEKTAISLCEGTYFESYASIQIEKNDRICSLVVICNNKKSNQILANLYKTDKSS